LETFLHCIATGLYTGYLPWAPGTWATILIGIPFYLGVQSLGKLGYGIALIPLVFLGIYAAGFVEAQQEKSDPHFIVIDEIVGYLFAMVLVPLTLRNIILSCALFRLFDIIKPYPIGLVDQKMKGGAGIVLDDLIAGIFANLTLRALNWFV
jgi:phosphatidylglycerophosphatase A